MVHGKLAVHTYCLMQCSNVVARGTRPAQIIEHAQIIRLHMQIIATDTRC